MSGIHNNMKLHKILLTWALLISTLTGCKYAGPSQFGQNRIEFTIEFGKEVFCSHEDVRGTALIENSGSSPYLIFKNLDFFPVDTVIRPNAYFVIKKPSGEIIDFISWINIGSADASWFIPFEPGNKIETDIEFVTIYSSSSRDFNELGTYSVYAIYQNRYKTSKVIDGHKMNTWVGNVKSNTATFLIDQDDCGQAGSK